MDHVSMHPSALTATVACHCIGTAIAPVAFWLSISTIVDTGAQVSELDGFAIPI